MRLSIPFIIACCNILPACDTIQAQSTDVHQGSLLTRPRHVGIHLGSQGLGFDYTQEITPRLYVRAGASHLPFSYRYAGNFSNASSTVHLKTRHFTNAHVLADWYPVTHAGFRITPGVAYFFSATATALVQPSGNFKYGDIPVSGEQVGTMEGQIMWRGLAPYLGAGWLFHFRNGASPLSLGIDLGSYYLPPPDASLTGTRLLENNSENEAQFQKNVKDYRWLPLLQASLHYTF